MNMNNHKTNLFIFGILAMQYQEHSQLQNLSEF